MREVYLLACLPSGGVSAWEGLPTGGGVLPTEGVCLLIDAQSTSWQTPSSPKADNQGTQSMRGGMHPTEMHFCLNKKLSGFIQLSRDGQ